MAQAVASDKHLSDRARAERRTGWLLCAPAVILTMDEPRAYF